MMLALVYPLLLGLGRIESASFLRGNGTFRYLTGLPSFLDAQTLRRFLAQAPADSARLIRCVGQGEDRGRVDWSR